MLKLTSILSDTVTHPLDDCCFNAVLVKLVPFCNESFFHLVDVTDAAMVDSLLQNAPDHSVNRTEVRAVRWPVLWTSEVWCLSWKL